MLALISGLPRSGKSTFADAIESSIDGFTHVPLDKYIKEIPDGMGFLDWVDQPECIDWELLNSHILLLKQGGSCFTPQPNWRERGKRASEGGAVSGGRCMQPATIAYIIPGCHAFKFPESDDRMFKIYMETSHEAIAGRLTGGAAKDDSTNVVFEKHLSRNWKDIENYSKEADLILRGTDPRELQIGQFLSLLGIKTK